MLDERIRRGHLSSSFALADDKVSIDQNVARLFEY